MVEGALEAKVAERERERPSHQGSSVAVEEPVGLYDGDGGNGIEWGVVTSEEAV